MSKQVVTIGYLKSFVSGAGITVTATTSQTDTYCPKYSELTGGSLVKLYNESTYSTDNTNGILIDTYSVGDSKNSYSNTQLVVRADLKVVSTELTGVTVNKSPTSNVNGSGGSVTISVTGKFKTTTKEETGSTSETNSEIVPISAMTATSSQSYATLSNKNATSYTLTFTENKTSGTRSSVVTAKYKNKTSVSGTVSVTQSIGGAISGYTDFEIRNINAPTLAYNKTANTITYDVYAKPVYYSGGTGSSEIYEAGVSAKWTGSKNNTCSDVTRTKNLTYQTATATASFTHSKHPDTFVSSSFTITNVSQDGTIPASATTANFKYSGKTVTVNFCTTSYGNLQTGSVSVSIPENDSCNVYNGHVDVSVSGGSYNASYTQQGTPDEALSSSFTVTNVTSALTVASGATSATVGMSGHWITKHSCIADTTGETITSSRTMSFKANSGCQRTITSSWTWNSNTVRATVTQGQYDGITARSLTNCAITSISPTTVPGSGGTVTVKWSGKTHSYHACTGDATGTTTGSTPNTVSKNNTSVSRTVTVVASPSWCGQTADDISSSVTQAAGVTCTNGWSGNPYVDDIEITNASLARYAFTYNYSSAVPISASAVVSYKRRYVTYNLDCSIKTIEERDYSSKTVNDITKFSVKRYDMTEAGIYIELSDSHTTWYTINSNNQLVIPANSSHNPREGYISVTYIESGISDTSNILTFNQDGVPCQLNVNVVKHNAVNFYPDATITVGNIATALTTNTNISVPNFYEGYNLGVTADNGGTGNNHVVWDFQAVGFLCGSDYKFTLKRRNNGSTNPGKGDVEVTHQDGTTAPEVEITYRDL